MRSVMLKNGPKPIPNISKIGCLLAKDGKTHQEILYYMAQNDPDPAVRAASPITNQPPFRQVLFSPRTKIKMCG
jgi:hypothetical protein